MKPILLSFILFSTLSCSQRIYVSPDTLNEWRNKGIDVGKLQLRNDKRFEWVERMQSNDVSLKSGGILSQRNERKILKTFVHSGTPCVITGFSDSTKRYFRYMYVSFDLNEQPFLFEARRPAERYYYEINGTIRTRLYV